MERIWKGIWLKHWEGHPEFATLPPAPLFRKEFTAPKQFSRAVIHLCGLGWHELFVNGQKADDRWYAPSLTQYDCRVGYIDYDVTALLKPGKANAIVVHLGNGFYNCHNEWKYTVNFYSWRGVSRFICDVDIDGDIVACSGLDWKFSPGPVTYDCHHEGEDYDARLEIPGCFQPGFDDSAWSTPKRAVSPGGLVLLDTDEPCRVIEKIPAKSVKKLSKTDYVYDFGTTLAGVVEFRAKGKAGDKITIKYAEMLDKDGHADTSNLDMKMPRFETDSYIFRDGKEVTWHPRFVWHGFRYVEVTCSSPSVDLKSMTGLFISSDLREAGKFTCSHPILNKIQEITRTSYRCNFMGIPTDCPTREKFGWTGDADVVMETGFWNYVPLNGLKRLQNIIADIQRPDGTFSTHGPTSLWGMEETCPSYSVYLYDFCYYALLFLDDDSQIREYYPKLRKGVKYFETYSNDDHLVHMGYADWCNPLVFPQLDGSKGIPSPDCTMVESISWLMIVRRMLFFAEYLGEAEDATHYRLLANQIQDAINDTFFDAKKKIYKAGFDWASNAMALTLNVVPEKYRQAVADNLVKMVRAKKHQVWVGIQGAKHVPRALVENGYPEDAFQMLVQSEFPGWGNIIARGATSLWETWTGLTSRNHIMFGDVSAWMYRYLGGIIPTGRGFSTFRIQPYFLAEVKDACTEHQTPHGLIRSAWKRGKGKKVTLKLTVPDGTVATLALPGRKEEILQPGEYTFTC